MKMKQTTRAAGITEAAPGRGAGVAEVSGKHASHSPHKAVKRAPGSMMSRGWAEHERDCKRRSSKGRNLSELEQSQKVSLAGGNARFFSTLAMGGVNVSTKKY